MKAWTLGPGHSGAGRGSQHPASSWLVLLSVDPPGTQTGAQEKGTQIPVPWEHIPTGPGAASLIFPCCPELPQGSQGFLVPLRDHHGTVPNERWTWSTRNAQPGICLTREVKQEEGSKEAARNWLSHRELAVVTADFKKSF